MDSMERLEAIVAELPEAERVDIAEWGDHPTFRVRGKNFVFSDQAAQELSLKEWARTSCTLVAPKLLSRLVVEEDAAPQAGTSTRTRRPPPS